MDNESQMDNSEALDENAECLVDNKQQSILSFFKPVPSKTKSKSLTGEGFGKVTKCLTGNEKDKVIELIEATVVEDACKKESKKKNPKSKVKLTEEKELSADDTGHGIDYTDNYDVRETKKRNKKKEKRRPKEMSSKNENGLCEELHDGNVISRETNDAECKQEQRGSLECYSIDDRQEDGNCIETREMFVVKMERDDEGYHLKEIEAEKKVEEDEIKVESTDSDFESPVKKYKKSRNKKKSSRIHEDDDERKDFTTDRKEANNSEEFHTLARRSRRQNRQKVNYIDEFTHDDDDDDDDKAFEPETRKMRRRKVFDGKSEQHSQAEKCAVGNKKGQKVEKKHRKSGTIGKEVTVSATEEKELLKSDCNVTDEDAIGKPKQEDILDDEGKPHKIENSNVLVKAQNHSSLSFLAQFSKQKLSKFEDVIVIEKPASLPAVSHINQMTSLDLDWYQSIGSTWNPKWFCNVVDADLDSQEPMKVSCHSNEADWISLVNPLKHPKKETSIRQSIPLTTAINELLASNNGFPFLEILNLYVDCQMNVLKQCLAKIEQPKSNLRIIWERQEKNEKACHFGSGIVEVNEMKPIFDIRNMFGKAKPKRTKNIEPDEKRGVDDCEKNVTLKIDNDKCVGDSIKTSGKCDKKSRKRNSKKDDGKVMKNTNLDSSIEIVTKEEAVLKKSNTIEESFTKISRRARTEGACEVVEKENEEDVTKGEENEMKAGRRQSSRRSSKRMDLNLHEELVDHEDDNKRTAYRGTKRERRKRRDEEDRCLDEEDHDGVSEIIIEEKHGAGDMNKKRKKKKGKKLKGKDIVTEAETKIEEGDIRNLQCDDEGGVKKRDKQGKKKKMMKGDSDENFVVSENVKDDETCKPFTRDIRSLFTDTRGTGRKKVTENNLKKISESRDLKSDDLATDNTNPHDDNDKEESAVGRIDEDVMEVMSAPLRADIRNLFRRSLEVSTHSKEAKESEDSCFDKGSKEQSSSKVDLESPHAVECSNAERQDNDNSVIEKVLTNDDKLMEDYSSTGEEQKTRNLKTGKNAIVDNMIHSDGDETKMDEFRKEKEKMERKNDATKNVLRKRKGRKNYAEIKKTNEDSKNINDGFQKENKTKDKAKEGRMAGENIFNGIDNKEKIASNCRDVSLENSIMGYFKPRGVQREKNDIVSSAGEKEVMVTDDNDGKNDESCHHSPDEDMNESKDTRSVENEVVVPKPDCAMVGECSRVKRKRDLSTANEFSVDEPLSLLDDISTDISTLKCISKESKRPKICLNTDEQNTASVSAGIKFESDVKNEMKICETSMIGDDETNTDPCGTTNSQVTETLGSTEGLTADQKSVNEFSNDSDDVILDFHEKNLEHESPPQAITSSNTTEPFEEGEAKGIQREAGETAMAETVSNAGLKSGCDFENEADSCDRTPQDNPVLDSAIDDVTCLENKPPCDGSYGGETKRLEEDVNENIMDPHSHEKSCTDRKEDIMVSCSKSEQARLERPKRKRKDSVVASETAGADENGRRRSSRVKEKEERKFEENMKMQNEQNEKTLNGEKSGDRSPKMKRRRKSKNIPEVSCEVAGSKNVGGPDNEETNGTVPEYQSTGGKFPGTEDNNGEDDSLEVLDIPSKVSSLDSKARIGVGNKKCENIKSIELPVINEAYINASLLWTEKYAPMKHDHVIGNRSHNRQIFDWLSNWKEKHEHFVMRIMASHTSNSRGKADDHSDFEDYSDEDEETLTNTFVIIGKIGCGSTSIVYACANELGYKVLEMHPSKYRSGKQIQALLGEATQSHQVKRRFHGSAGDCSSATFDASQGEKDIISFFGSKDAKNGPNHVVKQIESEDMKVVESSQESSQGNVTGEMSLILFEQADVVFDEFDKGFWFALNELRKQAKRPIIITANDPSVITKLDGCCYETITMASVEECLIVNHLLAMSLAENFKPAKSLIEKIVRDCNNDIRKSILKLQFLFDQWREPCYKSVKSVIESLSDVKENIIDIESESEQDFESKESGNLDSKPKVSNMVSNETDNPDNLVLASKESEVLGSKSSELKLNQSNRDPLQVRVDKSVTIEAQELNPKDMVSERIGNDTLMTEGVKILQVGTKNCTDIVEEPLNGDGNREETEPSICVIERDDVILNDDDQNNVFGVTKVDFDKLFKNSRSMKGGKPFSKKAPFNASRAMDLVSASADALSFVNTFPQPKGTHRSYDAHRYGWWHSFAIDGISDEERLFLDTDHVMTLEEICKITGDVYSSVHDKVLGEYDTVGCKISSDKNSELISETFMALENCLSCSVRTDHRSLCLDTIPTLSMICRSEENRKEIQFGRRSRRFLHYLDTINLHMEADLHTRLVRNSFANQ